VSGCRRELAEDAVDAAITVVWRRMSQAALLSDRRVAAGDLAGAAVWSRVAVDVSRPPPSGDDHHLGSSRSWQDRSGE
jgi:hypothetical protein